jgi:hypothetical protein
MSKSLTANQQDNVDGELVKGSSGKNGPELPTMPGFLSERQKAEVSLKVTRDAGFSAKAEITNGGLLSIAVLVSSILLSTAVLVHIAVKGGKTKNIL